MKLSSTVVPLLVVSLHLVGWCFPQRAVASQLVEVRSVDQDVLMIRFRDGEVVYRDDGTGPSAFLSHETAPGDSRVVAFGEELDTDHATRPSSWRITSPMDESYGVQGLAPIEVHRKAKACNVDLAWDYKLDHWVYLRLPRSLRSGAQYVLRIDPITGSNQTEVTFTFDIDATRSEAIHVNLIGYTPSSPVKAADLYLWLGDGGPRDYRSFEGNRVWLLDVVSGERHEVGEVAFWKRSSVEKHGRNLTGSDVWTADFSGFNKPGRYRLVVEGVGCSSDFDIRRDVWRRPYSTTVLGYYYMRVGEPFEASTPPPRQPPFIPGEDPSDFVVYLTDLDPFDPEWANVPGDPWDEPHFKAAAESVYWAHRLPGNPLNPNAIGGHADALDWDRHVGHVSSIYDLLLPYLLSNGALDDDDLGIPESGNGVPDLIDEARNEVDLWLRLRDGLAYAHGLTNPTRDHTVIFQAGATTMAAWANAANCAMLAEAFRIAGEKQLMAHYRDAAITAYRFASSQVDRQLDDEQHVGDAVLRGRDFRMMAAAFLFNVTGDRRWEQAMVRDSVATSDDARIEEVDRWCQTWGTAAYLMSPHEPEDLDLVAAMRGAIRRQAIADHVRRSEEWPSRRSAGGYFQTTQNLHLVVLDHAFSEDEQHRQKLERTLILEADWGLGRNPSNLIEMTGLGTQCIQNCYTNGRNDGVPGLYPGHTPYNGLDVWGGPHNGSNPRWFTDRGYPDWDAGGWPHQEAHFNCRYSWSNGEFTPQQTMRGKVLLYGYLQAISATP